MTWIICWFVIMFIFAIVLCLIIKLIETIIKKIKHKTVYKKISLDLTTYLVCSILPSFFIVAYLETVVFYNSEKYKVENITNIALFSIDNEKCENVYLINLDNDILIYNDGKEIRHIHLDKNSEFAIENSEENYLVITEYKYYNEWYEMEYNNKTEYTFFINDEYILS